MIVFIYWNLHKKAWSIMAKEGPNKGKVISHVKNFRLDLCTFKVSEAGRQRVLRQRRKNVHAGVIGHLTDSNTEAISIPVDRFSKIRYNPYLFNKFFVEDRDCCGNTQYLPISSTSVVYGTDSREIWGETSELK